MRGEKRKAGGFTLIEIAVVVLIIGILAAIAMPQYSDYLLKGKLAEAMTLLSDLQVRQEQYYQDNRTYANGMTPRSAGQYFTTCSCTTSNAGQNFTCTATSPGLGYSYSVADSGAKTTTKPDGSVVTCWLKSANGSC